MGYNGGTKFQKGQMDRSAEISQKIKGGFLMMLQTMAEQKVLFYTMTAVCVIGVLSQLILNRIYSKLLSDTKNTSVSHGRFMKQLKQRFANCQRLNDEVSNVSAFIKRQLLEYRYWNMNLHQWQRVSAYAFVMCAALAGAGYFLIPQAGAVKNLYLKGGAISCIVLLVMGSVMDFRYKNKNLQTRLEDFLENTGMGKDFEEISIFDEKEKRSKKGSGKTKQSSKEKQMLKENIKNGLKETAAESEAMSDPNAEILKQMDPQEQERIIREVLKEFLA